jgi:hypothetical protein
LLQKYPCSSFGPGRGCCSVLNVYFGQQAESRRQDTAAKQNRAGSVLQADTQTKKQVPPFPRLKGGMPLRIRPVRGYLRNSRGSQFSPNFGSGKARARL